MFFNRRRETFPLVMVSTFLVSNFKLHAATVTSPLKCSSVQGLWYFLCGVCWNGNLYLHVELPTSLDLNWIYSILWFISRLSHLALYNLSVWVVLHCFYLWLLRPWTVNVPGHLRKLFQRSRLCHHHVLPAPEDNLFGISIAKCNKSPLLRPNKHPNTVQIDHSCKTITYTVQYNANDLKYLVKTTRGAREEGAR